MSKKSQKIYLGKIENSGEYTALYSEKENGYKRKMTFKTKTLEGLTGYISGVTTLLIEDTALREVINGLPEKDVQKYYPDNRITPLSELELKKVDYPKIESYKSSEND